MEKFQQWIEPASDGTNYVLAYADGIYCVTDCCGAVVCEFIRTEPKPQALTLEELREMDGQPVYIRMGDGRQFWAIVAIDGESICLYNLEYDGDCPDEVFYALDYDLDPDSHFGLHILGWIAYDHQLEDWV